MRKRVTTVDQFDDALPRLNIQVKTSKHKCLGHSIRKMIKRKKNSDWRCVDFLLVNQNTENTC